MSQLLASAILTSVSANVSDNSALQLSLPWTGLTPVYAIYPTDTPGVFSVSISLQVLPTTSVSKQALAASFQQAFEPQLMADVAAEATAEIIPAQRESLRESSTLSITGTWQVSLTLSVDQSLPTGFSA